MIHMTSTCRTQDKRGWHAGYIAFCRCGWVSEETWATRDQARTDGDAHLAEANKED